MAQGGVSIKRANDPSLAVPMETYNIINVLLVYRYYFYIGFYLNNERGIVRSFY
jgi:hypothetical protein